MVSLVGIGGLNLRPLSHLTTATRLGKFLLGYQFLKVINCLVGLILLNDSAETEQEFKCSSCTANVLAKLQLETFFIFFVFSFREEFRRRVAETENEEDNLRLLSKPKPPTPAIKLKSTKTRLPTLDDLHNNEVIFWSLSLLFLLLKTSLILWLKSNLTLENLHNTKVVYWLLSLEQISFIEI